MGKFKYKASKKTIDYEKELVSKILKGDEEAFNELYNDLKYRIASIISRYVRSDFHEREDVLQNTFLCALRKLKEFRFESSLYTWIAHIAINFSYQAIQRRAKPYLDDKSMIYVMDIGLNGSVLTKRKDKLKSTKWNGYIYDELKELSKNQRNLILKREEGYSYKDIADELNIPVGSIMSGLFRGKEKLRIACKKREILYNAIFGE